MKTKELEKRMYGLVPYNISPIQQAIQFGHAVVEMSLDQTDEYFDWAANWKTFIILNGGTSNDNPNFPGTMQHHLEILKEKEISHAIFNEPDLNNMLSAIVFLVDEQVFNKEDFPDFSDYLKNIYIDIAEQSEEELKETFRLDWFDWRDVIGEKNVFLREFLKQFKLA